MSAVDPIVLPGKYVNEKVVVSCNFAKRIAAGVGLTTPVVTAEVLSGVDATPSAILSGSPSISGTRVLQYVIAGTAGVSYKLIVQVDTDEATPQRLIEELDLAVESP